MATGSWPSLLGVVLALATATVISSAAIPSSSPEQAGHIQESYSCMPCSRAYIGDADHNTLAGQLPQRHYLAEQSYSDGSCKGLADDIEVPALSELHRKLVGEGSHCHLVYSVKFVASQDNFLDACDAHLVVIESLPSGVFADPFELQHFVERKVFRDVAVFGDTNLELPSALSNRSAVEVHVDLNRSTSMNFNLEIDLPLHARYPPLDASGYATVEFGNPHLFLRYQKKNIQEWLKTGAASCCCRLYRHLIPPPEQSFACRHLVQVGPSFPCSVGLTRKHGGLAVAPR